MDIVRLKLTKKIRKDAIYRIMFIIIILGTIYFILLDELIMGSAQRRIGPLNLGWYGFLSSIINGCNLIISQFLVTKLHLNIGFQSFPVFFILSAMTPYLIIGPFFLIDIYISMILLIVLSSFSIIFIIYTAFSGLSKYSILGCIRLISQFISFELMISTIIVIMIWSWNDLTLGSYFLLIESPYIEIIVMLSSISYLHLSSIPMMTSSIPLIMPSLPVLASSLSSFFTSLFNLNFLFNIPWLFLSILLSLFYLFLVFSITIILSFHLILWLFFICILAESNRVPFDISEAESELVAGFITEYSSIYFSLILLTEYANIIAMSYSMLILFSIFNLSLIIILLLVCLIRATLNRLKFDELMTNAWILLLPILFYLLFITLLY